MNMVGSKYTFQTKSPEIPPSHLKQSWSASLKLSILGTLLNPHKKWNIMGKFQAVGAKILEHRYSPKL